MASTVTSSGVVALDGPDARRREPEHLSSYVSRVLIRRAALCAIAMACVAAPSLAQKAPSGGRSPSAGPSGPISAPSSLTPGSYAQPDGADPFEVPPATQPGVITVNGDSARMVEAEACNSWTESGVHSPTVSVSRLEVPDKATGEFQRACSSYKDKKFLQAENHARKAIDIYPNYAASWVLLGQVLDAEHNRQEAGKACSQAATLDPQYVAPYLCLAEFAARDENWDQLSKLSDEALAIDPVSNAYALYYSADANFHLKRLPDAETNARAAVPLDPWHHLPQVHLLLAHIYEAKGDPHSEIAELKEYLKQASNSPDAPAARSTLRQLESAPPKQP